MIQISISEARQILPSLINRVYQGEEFIIVKNKIPVAQITPVGKKMVLSKEKKLLPEAIKLFTHFKGSNIKIANFLRDSAWKGTYGG